MRTVAIAEAKDHFSELVAAAEEGEEIVITRHGRPVARLVMAQDQDLRARKKQVIEEMIALGQEMRAKYGPTPIEDLIAWKNEGRP